MTPWPLIEPLPPPWPQGSPGPKPVDDRRCPQGILYVQILLAELHAAGALVTMPVVT